MLEVGSLVKMKLGHSGIGIVQELFAEHPRANEFFGVIHKNLKEPHVKIFWYDLQCSEINRLSRVEVME